MRVHGASIPAAKHGSAPNLRSGRLVINAPSPPLRRHCGIHRRTAGLLARSVSPTPPSQTYEKAQWREKRGTPLTVAGAATDRRKVYRVPFSPSGVIEGPCAGHVPASRRVVKLCAKTLARCGV